MGTQQQALVLANKSQVLFREFVSASTTHPRTTTMPRRATRHGSSLAWLWKATSLIAGILVLAVLAGIPSFADPFAYVTTAQGVLIMDAANKAVVATIPVGGVGLAFTPDGSHLYAAGGSNVSVIDTATNMLVASIPVGRWAQRVAVTPDGTRAYVTMNDPDGAGGPGDNVLVIDTATNTVVATIRGSFMAPYGVAITPDGAHVYIANYHGLTLSVIDTASNTVVDTISGNALPGTATWVGFHNPIDLVFTPDGTRAYVANWCVNSPPEVDLCTITKGNVIEIDTATNAIVNIPSLPQIAPWGLAVTPDGARVYVTNGGNTVGVIHRDTTDTEWCCGISVPPGPRELAVTPDGGQVWVTSFLSNTISIIDTATNTVADSIQVGSDVYPSPSAIAFQPATPSSRINGLIAAVQALVNSGTLNRGQGNSLAVSLNHALSYLPPQPSNAIQQLQAFIDKVNTFMNGGVLTKPQGQPLINTVNSIIHQLGG